MKKFIFVIIALVLCLIAVGTSLAIIAMFGAQPLLWVFIAFWAIILYRILPKSFGVFGIFMATIGVCVYFDVEYPALHPIQGEDRQELWYALCDEDLNPLYADGISILTLTFPRDEDYTFDSFIGMDCPPPNWNEGLDPELTKDLHLISQFHKLFQHMLFAITDFIYVRKFRTEINVEITKP